MNHSRTSGPAPVADLARRRLAARRAGPRVVAERLRAQAALLWLLLALVLVPALGRLHQVVHGTALDRIHAGSVALADAPAAREAGHGLLDALVPHHTAADCQLLDQLALGHAVPAACVALPPLAPALVPPMHHADATGAWPVVQLRARGPPVT